MANRVQISLKLPPELLKRLDGLRATFPAVTERTACIERAIEGYCDRHEPGLHERMFHYLDDRTRALGKPERKARK